MLVADYAQADLARNIMASSLHAGGYTNAAPPSYTSTDVQSHRYGTASGTLNNKAGQQGLLSPSMPNYPSQPPIGDGVVRRDVTNIMNRKADMNSSLYQICLNLKQRLAQVPGFEQHILEMEEEEREADDSTDPVTSMWNCLRRGYPLMTIFNALNPRKVLEVDSSRLAETKLGKAATFKFLQACLEELKFPPNECFLITDLYGGDTTGFVKVTKVVNRVVDILSQKGLLLHTEQISEKGNDIKELETRSHRQHVVRELVMTERDYVQHLETLQQFKKQVEESGAITGDAIHHIFLNLNSLLDFQRRFLIRIEQQNSLPESQQNWGQLFTQYKASFKVYEPFIANNARCNESIAKEWSKLQTANLTPVVQGMVENQNILSSFLMKPFQRLSKYPQLLESLQREKGLDKDKVQDLADGCAAATSVLKNTNKAVEKEQRIAAMSELQSRVEDWKGHKMDHFGELLLYGSFTVLKGEGVKEVEREVRNIRMIIDELDPECRFHIRDAHKHIKPLAPKPKRGAKQDNIEDAVPVGDITSDYQMSPRRFGISLHRTSLPSLIEVPEEHADEEPPPSAHPEAALVTPKRGLRKLNPLKIRTGLRNFAEKCSPKSPSPHTPSPHSPTRGLERLERRNFSLASLPKKLWSPETPSPTTPSPHTSNSGLESLGRRNFSLLSLPKKMWSPKTISPTSPSLQGNLSQVSLQSSGEGLGSAPPTPSRKSKGEKMAGLLTDFSSKVKKSKAKIAKGLKLRKKPTRFPYVADHIFKYHFRPNGFLMARSKTIFLHSAIPNEQRVSEFVKPSYVERQALDKAKKYADKKRRVVHTRIQYKVYLFERILLCCKEINPNKPKNKIRGRDKPLVDKKGKLRLQLKGRIFMQNVTDVLMVSKSKEAPSKEGSWSIQIFWKGDPGVENFVIRFNNPELMHKWRDQVFAQKTILTDWARNSGQTGTSETEFTYLKNQASIQNPYEQEDDAEDEEAGSMPINMRAYNSPDFFTNNNISSTSLRLRSTTNESGPLPTFQASNRAPPPRYTAQDPAKGSHGPSLTLHTDVPHDVSLFSPPSAGSPNSIRSNFQAGFLPSRQVTSHDPWSIEDSKHNTAPVMGRGIVREGPVPNNSYIIDGCTIQRPSLPAMAASKHAHLAAAQLRSRSASSPNIHNPNIQDSRRYANGQIQAAVEKIPVPPIPAHMAQMYASVNRSETNSPTNNQLPIRSATQSPLLQREGIPQQYQGNYGYDQHQATRHDPRPYLQTAHTTTAVPTLTTEQQPIVPSPFQVSDQGSELPSPNQLRIKIWYEPVPHYVTIVVPSCIKYRSLADRIDSKMEKCSKASIFKNNARLRYLDSDEEFVTIASDEDVQLAIEDWVQIHQEKIRVCLANGLQAPDFELHWQDI